MGSRSDRTRAGAAVRSAGRTGTVPRRFSPAVDRTRCDGRGYCAELLPEMIRLDDWGYPIIAAGPLPDPLLEHARRAVRACPMLAIRLVQGPAPR